MLFLSVPVSALLPLAVTFKSPLGFSEFIISRLPWGGQHTAWFTTYSKQYVEEGLQAAIDRKVREKPPIAPTVTDEKEAELIALAGSEAPDGYSRWTLRLLEEKAMELRIVERISDTTIGRILKKHQIQLNHTLNDALKTKQTCKRHSL